MLTHPSLRPALVVGVVVAATTWFATRAGDLNPPKGPIQPTMVSLEDLYNRISTQGGCPTCAWQYKYLGGDTLPNGFGQVLTGPGLLHAVVLSNSTGGGFPRLYDWVQHNENDPWPRERTIARFSNFNNNLPATTVVLDVRFNDGVFLSGLGTDDVPGLTLIYRLDP